MKTKAERLEAAFNYHAESSEKNDPAGMAEARRLIIALFKECVPIEAVSDLPGSNCADNYCYGINYCREETLKNIEELR